MNTFLFPSGSSLHDPSNDQKTPSNSQCSALRTAEGASPEDGSAKRPQSAGPDVSPVSGGSARQGPLVEGQPADDTRSGGEPVSQEERQKDLRRLPGVLDWNS
jgi:hypothetical protein